MTHKMDPCRSSWLDAPLNTLWRNSYIMGHLRNSHTTGQLQGASCSRVVNTWLLGVLGLGLRLAVALLSQTLPERCEHQLNVGSCCIVPHQAHTPHLPSTWAQTCSQNNNNYANVIPHQAHTRHTCPALRPKSAVKAIIMISACAYILVSLIVPSWYQCCPAHAEIGTCWRSFLPPEQSYSHSDNHNNAFWHMMS